MTLKNTSPTLAPHREFFAGRSHFRARGDLLLGGAPPLLTVMKVRIATSTHTNFRFDPRRWSLPWTMSSTKRWKESFSKSGQKGGAIIMSHHAPPHTLHYATLILRRGRNFR